MVLVVFGASLGTVWFVRRGANPSTSTVPQPSPYADEPVNLEPPTEQDLQAVDQQKQDIVKDGQATTPPPSTGNTVTPVVTGGYYNPNVEVSGRIPGIFEEGGTCTFTLSKGPHTVQRETSGFKDYRDTLCTPIAVPRSEFPEAGDWTVNVSYISTTSSGSSSSIVIRVE